MINQLNNFVNLVDRCEQEQLHLSGAIQNRGALLRADAAGTVTHASANLEAMTGFAPASVLGQSLSSVAAHLLPGGEFSQAPGSSLFASGAGGSQTDVRWMRDADGGLLIELEPVANTPKINQHSLRKPLLRVPKSPDGLDRLSAALIDAFRVLTEFDRIMIYRFHEDWSGEVIAEHIGPGVSGYLGLRFPASDIPAIARRLYFLNPYRYIHEVAAPVVTVQSQTETPIDLSYTDLRSVSPVHLHYLNNMSVGMSFSVPLRVADKLWGLVACHHQTSKTLPMATREVCVSLAHTFCISLGMLLAEMRMRLIDQVNKEVAALAKDLRPADGLALPLHEIGDGLLGYLGAEGIACRCGNGAWTTFGIVPDVHELGQIDSGFVEQGGTLFLTDRLIETVLTPSATNVACGCAALRVSTSVNDLRIYWFRREEPQEVNWAGNPNKQPDGADPSTPLTPRQSFEKWVELRSGQSRPWKEGERVKLAALRNALAK